MADGQSTNRDLHCGPDTLGLGRASDWFKVEGTTSEYREVWCHGCGVVFRREYRESVD